MKLLFAPFFCNIALVIIMVVRSMPSSLDIDIEIQHFDHIHRGTFKIQRIREIEHAINSVTGTSQTNPSSSAATTTQSQSMSPQQIQSIADIKANGIYDNTTLLDQFKILISNNGLYKIKLRTISKDNKNSTLYSKFITTAIPACELQKSGFKEEILLYVSNNEGKGDMITPIGLSYSSPVIALSRPCDPNKIKLPLQFHTRIKIMEDNYAQSVPLAATGPLPIALKNINKYVLEIPSSHMNNNWGSSDGGRNNDGRGRIKEQTFLEKYWYIVLMLMAYLLFAPGGASTEKAKKK